MYKLYIPTAGLGSRSGYTKINKSLITVGDKPVIAHIIDKFPKQVPVVVGLGFGGSEVSQVLAALYPDRLIERAWVTDFELGPGHSIMQARQFLQCPFVFCCNDTLVPDDQIDIDPSIFGNWLACYRASLYPYANLDDYRTVTVSEAGMITNIFHKGARESTSVYTGLAGVKDYKSFWSAMEYESALEGGESIGLRALDSVKAVFLQTWYDTGSSSSLPPVRRRFPSSFNILEKEGEAIWFTPNRVIKFNVDPKFIDYRLKRMQFLPADMLPRVVHKNVNLFAYDRVPGQTLSGVISPNIFSQLFEQMYERVWQPRYGYQKVSKACWSFYKVKTYERLRSFFNRYETIDRVEDINGVEVESVVALLSKVDWNFLCESPWVSNFHGDFHNENILITASGEFVLLDWRQDFGKLLDVGDAYYDFAKFNTKLLVSDEVIAGGDFEVYQSGENGVKLALTQCTRLREVKLVFDSWITNHGFSLKKVNLLTALILLNIACLHTFPYSLFCYYMGKELLNREVNSR